MDNVHGGNFLRGEDELWAEAEDIDFLRGKRLGLELKNGVPERRWAGPGRRRELFGEKLFELILKLILNCPVTLNAHFDENMKIVGGEKGANSFERSFTLLERRWRDALAIRRDSLRRPVRKLSVNFLARKLSKGHRLQ